MNKMRYLQPVPFDYFERANTYIYIVIDLCPSFSKRKAEIAVICTFKEKGLVSYPQQIPLKEEGFGYLSSPKPLHFKRE